MLEQILYTWACSSLAASGAYLAGRIKGREAGYEKAWREHRQALGEQGREYWDERLGQLRKDGLAKIKQHGTEGHLCTAECYHYVRR